MTNPEFNRQNLLKGLDTLRFRKERGIVATPDVSDSQFQANTNASIDFLAGYVVTLIERIDELEARLEPTDS